MKDLITRKIVPTVLFSVSLGLLAAAPAARANATTAHRTAPRTIEASTKVKVETGIEWQIEPGEVVVHLDGKKVGLAKDLTVTAARPGKHVILLVKGGDESEMEVKVTKGQRLKVVYSFSE
ncbi:MAG: hypothetical protein H6729_06660 [Deltaproteobacteria bacterium]|nr:hypothetical protein [Deltaproteobacteria bacterium]